MSKIGILTYHHYYNYGTALQAYALEHYISKKIGCDVEIIDFILADEYVGRRLLFIRAKRMITYLRHFKKYYTLWKGRDAQKNVQECFEKFFREYFNVSERRVMEMNGLQEVCKDYSAIMIGSDQTWNPYVSGWRYFLLDFLEDGIDKICYAPSLGTGKIPAEYKEEYFNALSDFKALSCREQGGAAFLTDFLQRRVESVLDPTLLLTQEDWKALSEERKSEEPYLLTYFLGDNLEYRKVAKKIAKENGLKIIALPMSYHEMCDKKLEKQFVGPKGFITLICNASFICTDSFHGTMFAINFEKQFLSFVKRNDEEIDSDNNRLYDALHMFGLESRMVKNGLVDGTIIDYDIVRKKLSQYRKKSHDYLSNTVSEVLKSGEKR